MTDLSDVQGNVLNGYTMSRARYVFLTLPGDVSRARELLGSLLPYVTHGGRTDPKPQVAVNVAITDRGYRALGVSDAVVDGFPATFRTSTRDRAADLGDVGPSDPHHWDAPLGTSAVHLLVTLHGGPGDDLAARAAELTRGATVLAEQDAHQLPGKREHFGYADGTSQPDIENVPRSSNDPGGGVPLREGGWRRLRLGEFVLGHPDEDGVVVTAPHRVLVRNGSYVVYRKLAQDVIAFRTLLDRATALTGLPRELTAAKLFGRWRDGQPLVTAPSRPDARDLAHTSADRIGNDFRYLPDRVGQVCPLGAHIRRVNPRDSLDFDGAVREGGLLAARHRIIRRGMPYGPELADDATTDDGEPRGLIFVCYQADVERQFETVQRQWCNDGDTFGLGADGDLMFAAAGAKLTVPRAGSTPAFVPSPGGVVTTRGSEYLFAPGISALRALAAGTL